MNYKLTTIESKQDWDAFVQKSPQGSIFCESFFLDALMTKYRLFGVKEKEKLVAVCVVLLDEDGMPRLAPYTFSPYQGIMFVPSDTATHSRVHEEFGLSEFFVQQLLEIYPRLSFCLSPAYKDMRAFLWHHYHESKKGCFKVDLRYTGIVPLWKSKHFDEYVNQIRTVRRQEYRYAQERYGLTVEISDNLDVLDTLHALTFERQGIQREKEHVPLVRNITRGCLQAGRGRMLVAKKDDVPVSANVFLFDSEQAYYLFGANDPAHRNTGASTFLILEQIRHCIDKGISYVDMVGVNSPNRGDYKVSFNADLVPYVETHIGF